MISNDLNQIKWFKSINPASDWLVSRPQWKLSKPGQANELNPLKSL